MSEEELSVWVHNDPKIAVIAETAKEAQAIALKCGYRDDELSLWEFRKPDETLTLNDEEEGLVTKPCAEWVKNGRGFLARGPMNTKVTVYGLKKHMAGVWDRLEYESKEARDGFYDPTDGWTKYTVTRTVRAKGRPLWWAIRQLQEGRAVVDGDGDRYGPDDLENLWRDLRDNTVCIAWAQSWTLAKVHP